MLALLWAQLLGLAHGVLHAGTGLPGDAVVVTAQPSQAPGVLAHLMAGAGDERDCRLYDQLGHGGPLLQLPPGAVEVFPLAVVWGALLSRWASPCAAFAARAPPLSR